jgi:RNase P protein component
VKPSARGRRLVAVDIVMLARPGIERTEAGVLRAELDRLWLRLRVDA